MSAIVSGIFNIKYLRTLPAPKARTYVLDADTHTLPYNGVPYNVYTALRIPYSNHPLEYPADEKEVAAYIKAKVVKAMPSTEKLADARTSEDYVLTGDIIEILPTPGKKQRPADTKEYPPMFDIIGQVKSVNLKNYAFDVDVSQFTYANPTGSLPVTAIISEDSKWRNDRTKALPTIGSIVHFMGYLRGLSNNEDNDSGGRSENDSSDEESNDTDHRFVIEVNRICDFLTRGPPATPSTAAGTGPAQGSQPTTPSKSTLRLKRKAESPSKSTVSDSPSKPTLSDSPTKSPSMKAMGKRPERPSDEAGGSTSALSSLSPPDMPETRDAKRRKLAGADKDHK